jgi:hypothetical protein
MTAAIIPLLSIAADDQRLTTENYFFSSFAGTVRPNTES